MLVRFLDGQNQVARKVSEHYEVRGPIAQIERAKQGEVIFYRESELPAGLYTMETVVHDAPSGKSSVRFSTVEVPKSELGKLRMSSLMLVKRSEKLSEKDRRSDNPLLVKDMILSPNLGEPVSKASKELAFYFAAYPVQGGPAPESVIELLQNSASVAQLPMPVPAADAYWPHPGGRPTPARTPRARHLRAARRREAGNRAAVPLDVGAHCRVMHR